MANDKQKKLLLALDGSEQSLDAVWYVNKFPPFHNTRIVLFNVFSGIPESYHDLEKNPRFSKAAGEVLAWEVQQKKNIHDFMDRAREILLQAGIPSNAIAIKIVNKKKGIARDIIKEAKNGYNALITGRKSSSDFQEIVMGSVATKVVEKIAFIPVMIIGKIPPDQKLLVAVDGSENSLRAVEFVANTLGGFPYEVHLLHVIRGASEKEVDRLFFTKESLAEAETKMNAVFDEMKQCLMNVGFTADQIKTKIIHNERSRAGAIVQEARDYGFGTIVIGRRGLSHVQEFFMGRVSNKVLHTIRNRAVWVVT